MHAVGVVNRRGYGGQQKHLWIVSLDLMHTEVSFSPNLIDSLCLQVAWMPTPRDIVIFVLTVTQPITLPLAHARRVICMTNERHNL